ncbi:MAG: MBL fold metallo-hydrolase [Spirochaetales bacterium]|nr:MBL fold metallo-hydrolase [Spirochaetales bacterium]
MGLEVHMLKVSTLFIKNYVYLIIDKHSKKAALIDPVWDEQKIMELLAENNCTLSYILLTHSHPDHVHLADTLARNTGCRVHMSRVEIEFYGFWCTNLFPLHDEEEILLGNSKIKAILTPGHTKGSLCYIAGNNIFTGDTLFIEGCGLCWGRGADPAEMYDSLNRLKRIIPPHMKIYPAHRFGQKPGKSYENILQYNIYLDFRNKEDFIKYRMRRNQKLLFAFR